MYNLELTGTIIKKIRKKCKMSQEELAEKISMNTRSILRLENAKTVPTLETLYKIAKALDVDISDFFKTEAFEDKETIISDINNCIKKMNEEDLRKFYKAVYHYIH